MEFVEEGGRDKLSVSWKADHYMVGNMSVKKEVKIQGKERLNMLNVTKQ